MRYPDIDIAKGIGIIMIIGLHSNFHATWMITFEMPLFFLLSGCFFSCSMPFRQFFVKNVNSLFVPYLFFESPRFLYDVGYALTHNNVTLIDSFNNSAIPTATWFLLSLFNTRFIVYPIIKFTKNNIALIIGFVLSITGYIASQYHINNVLFINTTLTCSFYFILGYLLKELILRREGMHLNSKTYYALLGGANLILCYLLWVIHKPYIFYRENLMHDNYLLIILMALTGCFAILSISRFIETSRFFQFFGRNSLIVLGTHLYCIVLFRILPFEYPRWLLFFICILLEFPIIYMIKRLFPRLCGLKPLFKSKNLPMN